MVICRLFFKVLSLGKSFGSFYGTVSFINSFKPDPLAMADIIQNILYFDILQI